MYELLGQRVRLAAGTAPAAHAHEHKCFAIAFHLPTVQPSAAPAADDYMLQALLEQLATLRWPWVSALQVHFAMGQSLHAFVLTTELFLDA